MRQASQRMAIKECFVADVEATFEPRYVCIAIIKKCPKWWYDWKEIDLEVTYIGFFAHMVGGGQHSSCIYS